MIFNMPCRGLRGAACLLLAMASGCLNEHPPTAAADITLESLAISQRTVEADGATQVMLFARLSGPDSTHPVAFTTTAGEFVTAGTGGKVVAVAVGPDSAASIILRAPGEAQLARVSVRYRGAIIEDSIRFTSARGIDSLSISADSVIADGAALVVVRAVASRAVKPRQVRFSTSDGQFVQANPASSITVDADSAGVATALLRSGVAVGVAAVVAVANGHALIDTVRFIRAEPERIDVQASTTTLRSALTESVTVSAQLSRSTGKVSLETWLDFFALREDGQAYGFFGAQIASGDDEKVEVSLAPSDSLYRGRLTVIARRLRNGAAEVRDTTYLMVIP